jgi:hypothetical protein
MWLWRRAAIVCAVLAALPLVLFLAGTGLAEIAGCNFNPGIAGPCFLLGMDVSGLAGVLLRGTLPALMLAPPALLVIVVWLIAEIVNAWRG